ncbi:hypothetical protein DFH27DRAFT_611489 [Peziza echinospora]|nr:hypothetical protein DFH27DRAFT_611489 [Peziza echinospora]
MSRRGADFDNLMTSDAYQHLYHGDDIPTMAPGSEPARNSHAPFNIRFPPTPVISTRPPLAPRILNSDRRFRSIETRAIAPPPPLNGEHSEARRRSRAPQGTEQGRMPQNVRRTAAERTRTGLDDVRYGVLEVQAALRLFGSGVAPWERTGMEDFRTGPPRQRNPERPAQTETQRRALSVLPGNTSEPAPKPRSTTATPTTSRPATQSTRSLGATAATATSNGRARNLTRRAGPCPSREPSLNRVTPRPSTPIPTSGAPPARESRQRTLRRTPTTTTRTLSPTSVYHTNQEATRTLLATVRREMRVPSPATNTDTGTATTDSRPSQSEAETEEPEAERRPTTADSIASAIPRTRLRSIISMSLLLQTLPDYNSVATYADENYPALLEKVQMCPRFIMRPRRNDGMPRPFTMENVMLRLKCQNLDNEKLGRLAPPDWKGYMILAMELQWLELGMTVFALGGNGGILEALWVFGEDRGGSGEEGRYTREDVKRQLDALVWQPMRYRFRTVRVEN